MNAGVGIGQPNRKDDVIHIQRLLNSNSHRLQPKPDEDLVPDGILGWRTKTRLARFQLTVMRILPQQAGYVLPNDPTHNALKQGALPQGTRLEQFAGSMKVVESRQKARTAASVGNAKWAQTGPAPRKIEEDEFILISHDGRKTTIDKNICWELPEYGLGFVVYNRNDLIVKEGQEWKLKFKKYPSGHKHAGKPILDQIGTKDTIERIMNLGREWFKIHPEKPLQIGDISYPGGYDTPDHHGHQTGRIVDIRPIRKDSKLGSLNAKKNKVLYDRLSTIEFVDLVKKLYPKTKIIFGGDSIKSVVPDSSGQHNDHLHLEF